VVAIVAILCIYAFLSLLHVYIVVSFIDVISFIDLTCQVTLLAVLLWHDLKITLAIFFYLEAILMGNPLKSHLPFPYVFISCPLCQSHMQVALILLNDLTYHLFFLLSDIVTRHHSLKNIVRSSFVWGQ
jgi:hypothetical protein